MNDKQQAINEIIDFLHSDENGILITGTNQYKKHRLVMALIDKHYKNAKILFRINGMLNIADHNFTPLQKQPKAGEKVKIGHNYYEFDAFTSRQTWSKTDRDFNFAIVYPVDIMCRDKKIEPVENLMQFKSIGKLFLCSWTDNVDNDYLLLSKYYTRHIVYDAKEEDPAYHQRVLDIINELGGHH